MDKDNISIFNQRMYNKGIGHFDKLDELKEKSDKDRKIISLKEEYLMIIEELNKLEMWLDIIEKMYEKISTDFVVKTLDEQKKQLNKIKDEHINNMYNPKFKKFRDDKITNRDEYLENYRSIIIESYIEYFIEKLRTMDNYDDHDAIAINNIYRDVEMFVEMFLSISIQALEIPIVQYLRENILKQDGYDWIICSNCEADTYSDFNSCIKCKYPMRGDMIDF